MSNLFGLLGDVWWKCVGFPQNEIERRKFLSADGKLIAFKEGITP